MRNDPQEIEAAKSHIMAGILLASAFSPATVMLPNFRHKVIKPTVKKMDNLYPNDPSLVTEDFQSVPYSLGFDPYGKNTITTSGHSS
ncbi:hypothetical protein VE04_01104 [Pseudogymnoascus sp. 24MN13]|nr:hypothetical protein VE04_01104 [Pseudogymnoascus sp. 24MN13]